MDKIIVTGSSGFIGFSLSNHLLNNGYQVIGIDKHDGEGVLSSLQDERHRLLSKSKKFISIRRDLSYNIDDLENYFADAKCIIHLAATAGVRESNRNPQKYITNNVIAFSNVINLAKKTNVRHFIFASSSSVYGDMTPSTYGFLEDGQLGNIQSVYARTKRENEIEAFKISKETNMKITGLRFFSVYSPFGRPDMAPWIFATSIIKGLPITIYGDGLARRDFTYIDDVVRSIHKVIKIEHDANYEIYNVGCTSPRSVLTLLKSIESSLGKKAKITYAPKDLADVNETFANMTKFYKDYGNTGEMSFQSLELGIQKFCCWFIDYMHYKK